MWANELEIKITELIITEAKAKNLVRRDYNHPNHNYNKILDSDWLLARPIFYQIGARAAKVSNNKVSNNKVSNNKVSNNKARVLRMRALFTWFLVVTKYSLIFLKPSASTMAFLP